SLKTGLAKGTYFLIVDGSNKTSGDFHLTITFDPQTCGDGVVTPPEDCDDGNTKPGDGCDANCKFEMADTSDKCPGRPVTLTPAGLIIQDFTPGYADDYHSASCAAGGIGGLDRVYQVTPTQSGTLTATVGYETNGTDETCTVKGFSDPGCWDRVLYA